MSSSFITIGKIGFWAKEPLVEAVQICLINEIENQAVSKDWLFELKKELALHQFRFRAMEILNQEEKTKFKSKNEFILALNESQWSKANVKPYKTNYEKIFLLVQKLLKGELITTAASPIDYYSK